MSSNGFSTIRNQLIKHSVRPKIRQKINDDFKMLYTIPALPGSSGSPIFDKYGRLLAVNFAGFLNTQNFNYGIQTKKLQEYLIKNNIIKKNLN